MSRPGITPTPTAPVWPPGLKVAMALVLGVVLTAFTFVQYVPEDIAARRSGGAGETYFGPAEDDVVGSDAAGGVNPSSGTRGGGQQKAGAAGSGGAGVVGGAGDEGATDSDATKGGELACAPGKNGGKTDVGVTEDKIRLAANVVTDGAGSNFLGESPVGMEAVVNRVNADGGICGRTIELNSVNDSWEASRGHNNIKDYIKEGYFALPVVPSSEGLSAAIEAGTIQDAGIPVVGSDGMRKEQYNAGKVKGKGEWVWPVAVATVSQVRIMAAYAVKNAGGDTDLTFGIVYDQRYKFGVEGADALQCYLEGTASGKCPSGYSGGAVSNTRLVKRQAIEPGLTDYTGPANQFKQSCTPCDVVVFLLEPQTAKTWLTGTGPEGKGAKFTMGAQPLFNKTFADQCQLCDGIFVWTGYNPAIGDNRSRGDIARYISDVTNQNPAVDTTNQFLQGAYLGMEVFVKMLEACSPNLTRACVRQKMDSLTYPTDMTPTPLSWSGDNHFANKTARAYSITYDGPDFTGFTDERTGAIEDPTPGVVPPD